MSSETEHLLTTKENAARLRRAAERQKQTVNDPWENGFDAGYQAALNLALQTCEERARKHQIRKTRLAQDYQAEAQACAASIRKAAAKKAKQ